MGRRGVFVYVLRCVGFVCVRVFGSVSSSCSGGGGIWGEWEYGRRMVGMRRWVEIKRNVVVIFKLDLWGESFENVGRWKRWKV